MPASVTPQQAAFYKRVGAELRELREREGVTCEFVASIVEGDDTNRDRVAKMERGDTRIRLDQYLELMWFYRHHVPDHPAVQLAKLLLPKRALAHG